VAEVGLNRPGIRRHDEAYADGPLCLGRLPMRLARPLPESHGWRNHHRYHWNEKIVSSLT
jgi:hypothetical protein